MLYIGSKCRSSRFLLYGNTDPVVERFFCVLWYSLTITVSLLCSRSGSERTLFWRASRQGLLLQSRQVSCFEPGRAGLMSLWTQMDTMGTHLLTCT